MLVPKPGGLPVLSDVEDLKDVARDGRQREGGAEDLSTALTVTSVDADDPVRSDGSFSLAYSVPGCLLESSPG